MEQIIELVGCLIVILLIYYVFDINIKKIKKMTKSDRMKELTDRFPENEEICKSILKKLKNEKVKIKQNEDSKDKTSFYIELPVA